jgi:hypothetical protein
MTQTEITETTNRERIARSLIAEEKASLRWASDDWRVLTMNDAVEVGGETIRTVFGWDDRVGHFIRFQMEDR